MTDIAIPTLNDELTNFEKLFHLFHQVREAPSGGDVTLNFGQCKFLAQNAVAFLGGMIRYMQKERCVRVRFDLESLDQRIRMNLTQNGFLKDLGFTERSWRGNSVPYRQYLQPEKDLITEYLKDDWLGRGWVNVSPELCNLIVTKVWESYTNAFEHGNSSIGIFSCGQHYPNLCKLKLTVVDFGAGIPMRVRTFLKEPEMTSSRAIQWAFQPGNTTKQGIGRGLGLGILKEFVQCNGGELKIFSDDGYAIISKDREEYCNWANWRTTFPGVLVNITLSCDEKYYCLTSELENEDEVFF